MAEATGSDWSRPRSDTDGNARGARAEAAAVARPGRDAAPGKEGTAGRGWPGSFCPPGRCLDFHGGSDEELKSGSETYLSLSVSVGALPTCAAGSPTTPPVTVVQKELAINIRAKLKQIS